MVLLDPAAVAGSRPAEATLATRLAAVVSFYRYHHDMHGVAPALARAWSGPPRRSRYRAFLAHLDGRSRASWRSPMPVRPRRREVCPLLTPAQVGALLSACATRDKVTGAWSGSLRNRLLFATLAETGMRLGEVLCLTNADWHPGSGGTPFIEVVPRDHPHGCRVKGGRGRRIYVSDELERLYGDYLWDLADRAGQAGREVSDEWFCFVNLDGEPRFAPLRPERVYRVTGRPSPGTARPAGRMVAALAAPHPRLGPAAGRGAVACGITTARARRRADHDGPVWLGDRGRRAAGCGGMAIVHRRLADDRCLADSLPRRRAARSPGSPPCRPASRRRSWSSPASRSPGSTYAYPSRPLATVDLGVLPAPMRQEVAHWLHTLAVAGERVNSWALADWVRVAAAVAAGQDLCSFTSLSVEEWMAAARRRYHDRHRRLPPESYLHNHRATITRLHDALMLARQAGQPWWRSQVWDPRHDRRIPVRQHEPLEGQRLNFARVQPTWLREAIQWYFAAGLATGLLSWSSLPGYLSYLGRHFAAFLAAEGIDTPVLAADTGTGLRPVALRLLAYLRQQTTRCRPPARPVHRRPDPDHGGRRSRLHGRPARRRRQGAGRAAVGRACPTPTPAGGGPVRSPVPAATGASPRGTTSTRGPCPASLPTPTSSACPATRPRPSS